MPLRKADMPVVDTILGSSQMGYGTAKLAKDKENKALLSAGVGFSALLKSYFN